MGAKKPILIVDVDDVLFKTSLAICRLHNRLYGTDLCLEDFTTEHWWHSLPGGTRRAVALTNQLLSHPSGKGIPQIRHATEVVEELLCYFRVVPVTFRSDRWKRETERQLRTINVKLARNFEMCTDSTGESTPKALIARELDACAIVEDHFTTAVECSSLGMTSIVFGNYPWNINRDHNGGVLRAAGWKSAKKLLLQNRR